MRESNALVFACAYAGKKAGDVDFFCAWAELFIRVRRLGGWDDKDGVFSTSISHPFAGSAFSRLERASERMCIVSRRITT